MQVSAIIVTRNRPALLARAIESVRAQDHADIELVVVDNASDPPLSLAGARVVRSDEMLSAARARNLGMDHAGGQVLCFLDDDDCWLPGKLADVLAAFDAAPDLDFCYGSTVHLGPGGARTGFSAGPCEIVPFLRWRYIHMNALAIRRRVAETHRFNPAMQTYEDVEFAGRLVRDLKGRHIQAEHAVWNRDGRADQLTRRDWRRAWRNWKILCAVFAPEIAADPGLRRFYHRKMLVLALMFLDLRQAGTSARVLAGL